MSQTAILEEEAPDKNAPTSGPAAAAAAGVPAPSAVAARKAEGKALRKACPRSSHGDPVLGRRTRDPLALLEESAQDRVAHLLPLRYTRMSESPFAFFRGTAILQAHDLQDTPSAGIMVQCCGDCHLMNFGEFATPERTLVFDINDFDETFPGPFEWDVKRLAASFELAARWREFSAADGRRAILALVASYRESMADFAEKSTLEIWYAKTAVLDLLAETADEDLQKILRKTVKKATESTAEHVFHKLTSAADTGLRIVEQPPTLFRPDNFSHFLEEDVRAFFVRYRSTLSADRRVLFDRFHLIDAACKVVGVGSVGTRCYLALLLGHNGDPLFLQVKEARPSVLEGRAGPSPHANQGERIVIGQRLMQSASDIFLGWARGPEGRDFYVRQLRDMKVAPNLVNFSPRVLAVYAGLCGRVLARAHAKTGDVAALNGYLGAGPAFDEAIANYASAYADQVYEDYDLFRAAIRQGRFPVDTTRSELEIAVR